MDNVIFRMRSRPAWVLTLAAGVLANVGGATVSAVTIADNGVARAVVVVDPEASLPVRHAADELAAFLGRITGGTFEIVHEPRAGRAQLLVGPAAAAHAAPDFSTEGLGADGIVMRTVGDDLILAGGEPRGTLYAVYAFLEEVAGCRWWTPEASRIPRNPDLAVSELNRRHVPPFEHREIMIMPIAADPDWSVRNRCVGELHGYGRFDIMPERGGCRKAWPCGHSYFTVIPPETYFDEHPEWYSLIEGRRAASPRIHATLCLSNAEMQAAFLENFRREIREGPARFRASGGQYVGYIDKSDNPLMFASVSPEDDSGYPVRCRCEHCVPIEEAEASPAGLALRFANRMARGIRDRFPDKTVTMYAYHYTQKPPRLTRPEPGMVIYFCPIHAASQSRPLTDPRFRRWNDDLHGWLDVCDRVYLYDYPDNVSYHLVPHPNLRALAANIRNWAEIGVTGYFGDGIGRGSGGTEMAELRSWLVARLLWDPSQDPRALIREFCDGYYGAAGPHIVAYLDGMHDAVETSGDWLDLSSPPDAQFLSIETLTDGWVHLAAAEKAVLEDPVLLSRVRIAQLPVRFVCLARWNQLKYDASCRGIPWPFGDARPDALTDFMQTVRQGNVSLGGASLGLLQADAP